MECFCNFYTTDKRFKELTVLIVLTRGV